MILYNVKIRSKTTEKFKKKYKQTKEQMYQLIDEWLINHKIVKLVIKSEGKK